MEYGPQITEPRKRRKILQHEQVYLDKLPNAKSYERSFMHRQVLSHVISTKTDFAITVSIDGCIKFWKIQESIEFVREFEAHTGLVTCVSVNDLGTLFASVSETKELRIFDIRNFDMISMIELDFVPQCVSWAHKNNDADVLLAISDANHGEIHFFNEKQKLNSMCLHKNPVILLKYNSKFNTMLSIDTSGTMEYWIPKSPYKAPDLWKYKSDTDLHVYKKQRIYPSSLDISHDGEYFVTYGLQDRLVRIWKFKTAKVIKIYSEQLNIAEEMQQANTALVKLDNMEFGRRLAIERELDTSTDASWANAVFDESGNFVLYSTLFGIKMVNLKTNKATLIGSLEMQRFNGLSLYQGAPFKKKIFTIDMAVAQNQVLQDTEMVQPILFCTAYKKNRFFMFTRKEPKSERDVFNEKITKEEEAVEEVKVVDTSDLAHEVTIHTTSGDLVIKLFPEYAPKTVQNFCVHARNHYYDGHLFHRIIKGFMVQTGDPNGDGTGGESIWGGEFKDEISELKHDRSGTVSMANAGPNTNGSQFFLTTVPTPWLDGKHTIFGRMLSGFDVLQEIENTSTDNQDRPMEDIRICNITIRK